MTKNFLTFISQYKVIIPLIQRDYVQGRKEEEFKATQFLDALLEGTRSHLHLDFIYGRVDEDKGCFTPLDGQQRLTTLLLLYWFVSLEHQYIPELSNFSYEVRASTKDFLYQLTQKEKWQQCKKEGIRETIENANWFFLAWKHDPSVLAILQMLDLIEQRFKSVQIEALQHIEFDFLDLNGLQLTDELYVKMNARGKALSHFENFKSHFEQYIEDERTKARLDNEWFDIFWRMGKMKERDIVSAPVVADRFYYNFFYNITFNFYLEKSDTKLYCNGQHFTKIEDFVEGCHLFHFYKEVYKNPKNVKKLIHILNTVDEENEVFLAFCDKQSISRWQRARFYALSVGYVQRLSEEELERWLRVSYNLINNQLIRHPEELMKTIQAINVLGEHAKDIYDFIEYSPQVIPYFNKLQRQEEALKAGLIRSERKWEKAIKQAEEHWYLDGQIGFLLELTKVIGDITYDFEKFEHYRDRFMGIWNFAVEHPDNQILLYQALLSKGHYLPKSGMNHTFCSFETDLRTKTDNWRKVFHKHKYLLQALFDDERFEAVMDGLPFRGKTKEKIAKGWKSHFTRNSRYRGYCDRIEEALMQVVSSYDERDWRYYFIHNSVYIKYCEKLQIRWNHSEEIYLLNRLQMNGKHVELYSWDLYQKKLKGNEHYLYPFSKLIYHESSSWNQPCIIASDFYYDGQEIYLNMGYDKGFYLYFYTKKGIFPTELESLLESIDFEENKKGNLSFSQVLSEINSTCLALLELD